MTTIQIESPAGFIPTFDKEKGVLTFSEAPKNIRERLQTIGDVYKYNGTTEKAFEKKYADLEPDERGYIREKLIVNAYNEGKKPDFTDGTPKYAPYFKMPDASGVGFAYDGYCGRWDTNSFVGARLLFCGPDAKENMLDAVKKFLPQYEQSRTL